MVQSSLFDPIAAQKAKERGISVAAENRSDLLRVAKDYAEILYFRVDRPISTDDVYHDLEVMGYHPELLGNAWGSVFRGWRCVGFTNSTRVSNHSRAIRLWVRK